MKELWQRAKYIPCIPLGENGMRVTSSDQHIALSKRAAEESMVLLKNDNHVLPFAEGKRIAVFSKGQLDYVQGGTGSGMVFCKYRKDLLHALKEKEHEGKIKLYQPLVEFYEKDYEAQQCKMLNLGEKDVSFSTEVQVKKMDMFIGRAQEPDLPQALIDSAAEFTDTALFVLSRSSGESFDRTAEDYYLNEQEKKLLTILTHKFSKLVVLINTGAQIEANWLNDERIHAVLYMGTAGMEGGSAAANLLCGECSPCGKLAGTWAGDYRDYATSTTFQESNYYVDYEEDIFVGYRYFETIPGAAEKVVYPFGYGLSYTAFRYDLKDACESEGTICLTIDVTNTGTCAGKDILQVYSGAPQGKLGKAYRSLVAFAKTDLLEPGATQTMHLSFDIYAMSSYDDLGLLQKSAYVLESGEYPIWFGSNVRDVQLAMVYNVEEPFLVVDQLQERCPVLDLPRRMLSDGSFVDVPHRRIPPQEYPSPASIQPNPQVKSGTLSDVANGKISLDDLVGLFSKDQIAAILGGVPNTGVACTRGFGNLPEFDIPSFMTADSPSGVRVNVQSGIYTTCFPSESCIACSWDPVLVEEVTSAIGMEMKENNLYAWLAPALNIQRDPLGGRNFEYYSEDPLISGKLAAAAVRGAQKHRISACPKHFACNNKEKGRKESDSHLTERALREIYLKGFEICIKESDPKTIMTSYNLVNGRYASENADLITHILRGEWGFSGVVMTDWNNYCRHGEEVRCGNDLKMSAGDSRMVKYYYGRAFPRGQAESCVRNILKLILWYEGIEM